MKSMTLKEIQELEVPAKVRVKIGSHECNGILVPKGTESYLAYILTSEPRLDGLDNESLKNKFHLEYSWAIGCDVDFNCKGHPISIFYISEFPGIKKKKLSEKERTNVLINRLLSSACDQSKVFFYEKFFAKEIQNITIAQLKKTIKGSKYVSQLNEYINRTPKETYEIK